MDHQDKKYAEADAFLLLRAIWRQMTAVLLAALACGGLGFCAARYLIPPKYEASVLLYVNNSSISVGSTSVSLSDLNASQSLVNTYIVILHSRLTLNEVIGRLELPYSCQDLDDMIEAESVNSTEVFRVTVTSGDPAEAEQIANTIAAVLPNKIAQTIDGASVRVVDFAVLPEEPSSPGVIRYTIYGMLLGMLLGCGIVMLRELLDDQIRDEEYLLQTYSIPVLAVLPDLQAKKPGKAYGEYYAAAGKEARKNE